MWRWFEDCCSKLRHRMVTTMQIFATALVLRYVFTTGFASSARLRFRCLYYTQLIDPLPYVAFSYGSA